MGLRWRRFRQQALCALGFDPPPPPRCRVNAVMSNTVPPEWQQLLETISPPTSSMSYLIFKWEHVLGRKKEGEWRDRSRWVLYQCQPAWAIPTGIRTMLEDKPPRLLPEGKAHARRIFVDDWAHEMYRTHRVFPRPFWVLQGRNGGVPAGYSEIEAATLKALGEPTDPPPVGALPYAGFDWRTVEQILTRDKLLQAGMLVDAIVHDTRLRRQLKREAKDAERAFRAQFVQWFKGTLAPGADFLTWFTRRSESDRVLRVATRGEMARAREFEARYIDTGVVV